MDFNWDIGSIGNFESLWEEGADGRTLLNRVTVALIDASAQVGIPEITKENWATFAARVASFQAAATALVVIVENGWYTPLMVTHEDVRRHIGLRTTATPLNAAEFEQKLVEAMVAAGDDDIPAIAARPTEWGLRLASEAGPEDLPQPILQRPRLRLV